MADQNKIKRIQGGTLKTMRAQDATIPLNVDTYDGSYTVTPTTEQQTLATQNRMLTNNITVEAAAITTDYNDLVNKPQVNSVTLQGNKSLDDLGIASIESVAGKYTMPDSGIPATDLAPGVIPDVSNFYTKPSGGIPASDIADGVIPDVTGFYVKPTGGIPEEDIADGVIPDVSGFYTKPESGIPASDLADGVIPDVSGKLDAPSVAGTLGQVLTSDGEGGQSWQDPSGGGGGTSDYTELTNKPQVNSVTLSGNKSLSDLGIAAAADLADKQAKITASGILKGDGSGGVTAATAGTDFGTYSKPSGGIPSSDMASAVQTSLGKADTAYQKPSGGIPSTDIASGVIPDVSGFYTKPSGGIPDTDIASASTWNGKYAKPSGGIPKTDLASAVQTSIGKADSAYQKPSGGIPSTDLASAVTTSLGKADTAYQKPSGGIPSTDMTSAVQTSLGKADTAYQKPSGGIPSTDLASAVQTSLGKADSAYQKPSGGIPASDLASGVIPDVSGKLDKPSTAGTNGQVLTSDGNGGQSWQTQSGGNVIPVYTMTSASTATCNMTFAQVSAAVLAGKCDQAVMTYSGAEYTFHLDHRYTSDSSLSFYYIDISTASVPPKYIGKHYILHGANGNIGLEQHYVYEISDVTVNGSSVLSNGVASITVPDVSGKLDAPSTAGTNGQVLTSNGSGGQTWQTISGVLPAVTSSDNGKFLQVVSGAWAAVTVPTAVGVSF